MNTAQDVLKAIGNPAVSFTFDEIRKAWDLLKVRHNQVQALGVATFQAGDEVEFDARGHVQRGKVFKINQKTVSVQVGPVRWKVSPSALRRI